MTQESALLDAFAAAARGFGEAIKKGDPKGASRHRDQASLAYKNLMPSGDFGQAGLLKLLTADDMSVRYLAAVHMLSFAPSEGEGALLDIIGGRPSPIRLLAQTSLTQWRSGLLQL